jgi:hypothetical protein
MNKMKIDRVNIEKAGTVITEKSSGSFGSVPAFVSMPSE